MIRVSGLYLLALIFLSTASFPLMAQMPQCGSDVRIKELYQQRPDLKAERDALNLQIAADASTPTAPSRKTNAWGAYGGGTLYVVPCVVHVVYGNDPQLRDSISTGQALSQFPVFFQDYRKVPGTPGYGTGADMQIEFQPARFDPQGQPTTGVVYHYDPVGAKDDHAGMMQRHGWDRTRYCNLFVINSIGGNTLAYAYFPSLGATTYDGVVCGSQYFGSAHFWPNGYYAPAQADGRTMTHELGHWLALAHVFGDSNSGGDCGSSNCSNSGDYVCDTPPSKARNLTLSGPARQNTCTNDNPDRPDDFRNYMDYSSDDLHDQFTEGQKRRGLVCMDPNNNYLQRRSLSTDANLESTGTGPWGFPKANFWTWNQQVCLNTPVQFTDYSSSIPTRYRWFFPGATLLTSDTIANPVVQYAQPGSYDVRLAVCNYTGVWDTLTRPGFVTASVYIAPLPLSEDFENASGTVPDHWHLENQDLGKVSPAAAVSWARHVGNSANSQGSASMRLPNFRYGDYGQRDGLLTPAIYAATTRHADLSFAYAYCVSYSDQGYNSPSTEDPSQPGYGVLYTDTLQIYASTDCGYSWQRIYRKGGGELLTCANFSFTLSEFGGAQKRVQASEWKRDTLNLDAFVGTGGTLRLKFENINGYGNNLYLDDIKVEELPSRATTARSPQQNVDMEAWLAPNPARDGQTALVVRTTAPQTLEICLLDVLGRRLQQGTHTMPGTGEHRIAIDASALPAGIYWLQYGAQGRTHQSLPLRVD